jgi:exodeoxyribonuclease VII large subunit
VPDRKVLIERLKEMKIQMGAELRTRIERANEETTELRGRLWPQRFLRRLEDRKQHLADLSERFGRGVLTKIERERLLLKNLATGLNGRNPLAILARGYCIVEKNGYGIKSVATIATGDRLKIRFADGRSLVQVERVEHDRNV